jgi:hypothetical protein
MRSRFDWIPDAKWSACGASASSSSDWRAWKKGFARVDPGFFPPELVVQIKALACELPRAHQQPLMEFQRYYEQIAKPFEWKFTRQDLMAMLNKLKPLSLTTERIAA